MGTATTSTDTKELNSKCQTCGQTIEFDCAWRQGRCPHRPSLLSQVLADRYKSRFFNLLESIRKLF